MLINPPKFIRLRRDPVKLSKVFTIKWKGLWMILSSNSETFHTKGSLFHQCIPNKLMKRLSNNEKRPFFIDQSKSGKWNVNVFNRIAGDGDYLYSIKQTCKTKSKAEEWGVNYINTVYRTFDQVTTN